MIQRGDIWWVKLDEPRGSAPGFRRPVLVVQSDAFNRSRIGTIVALTLTPNIRLADAPGNVLLPDAIRACRRTRWRTFRNSSRWIEPS